MRSQMAVWRRLVLVVVTAVLAVAVTTVPAAAAAPPSSRSHREVVEAYLVDHLDRALAPEGDLGMDYGLVEVAAEAAPKPAAAAVVLTASTPEDVARWAEHKARNRKKYATPEKEAAAFEKFKANRRVIATRNAKAASKLNPKPFSSKGALATKSPAQFKAMLKTKRPRRGSGPAAPKQAPATKARFAQVRHWQAPNSGGSGKTVGKSGSRVGKSGSRAGKTGAKVGKSGSRATKTGAKAGKSGSKAMESGGGVGKSGAKATDAGGSAGKSGAKATDAGGHAGKSGAKATTDVIVNPGAQEPDDYFKPFRGAVFLNPEDKTSAQRVCRVLYSILMRRYANTEEQRQKFFGDEIKLSPMQMCQQETKIHSERNQMVKAYLALVNAPATNPFMNAIVSIDAIPRDQEQCGSCWAEVAIGSYEVALRKLNISTPQLSVQQVLDCARTEESHGCDGGTPMDAINWMLASHFATEAQYPYVGVTRDCINPPAYAIRPRPGGFSLVVPPCTLGDCSAQFKYEMDLLLQVQKDGPFVAYVDATNWQYYDKGIYPPSECQINADAPNHVVELLGYGHDNGTPYWIVKNSWGVGWGENGYIKLAMGVNSCGVANYVGHAKLWKMQ